MEEETDFESRVQLDKEMIDEKNHELGVLIVGQGFENFVKQKQGLKEKNPFGLNGSDTKSKQRSKEKKHKMINKGNIGMT